jgi:hypothetical protein
LLGIFKLRKNVWKETNGFRYFKLVQTDRNGSGNDRLCIGGIEIFGTLNEDHNCPNGFLRSLGLFGLDSLYPKNNNHDQNNRSRSGGKNDENSDEESVISYSNPSVINGDISDNMSEYSTTSSKSNNNSNRNSRKIPMPVVPKSIPGVLHFPAGFNSNYKINILPPRINTGNNSTTVSQISEIDNNQNKDTDEDYLGINEKKDSENNNDEMYYHNKYESASAKSAKNSIKSSKSGRSVLFLSENDEDKVAFSAEINGTPQRSGRPSSPTISPLSTKNLEILQREYKS